MDQSNHTGHEPGSTTAPDTTTSLGKRLGRAFGWSAVGNYLYAAAQFAVLLVIVARGTQSDVASFLLALAVAAPIFMTMSLNLRAALASDSAGDYTVRAYIVTRAASTAVGVVLVIVVSFFIGAGSGGTLAIVLMGLAKASESVSNLAQGAYLHAEKHEYVTASQISLAVLGYGGFVAVFVSTGNLEAALVALGIGWLMSALVVDSFLIRRVKDDLASMNGSDSAVTLARVSAPLGLERGATALAAYLPLIVLDLSGATVAAVAAFGVVSQTVRVVQVFARTSSFALIPALSRLYAAGEHRVLGALFRKLFLIVGIAGVALFVGAVSVGDRLIELIFGAAYVVDGLIEIIALNGASIVFLALTMIGLLSFRKFRLVLGVRILAIGVTTLFLVVLTGRYGVLGVASAAVLGNATSVVVGLFMIRASVRTEALKT